MFTNHAPPKAMEVMATHNISHESLNSHEPLQLPPTPDSETMQISTTTTGLPNNTEANNSIGCQTALSYARQDTLVPLTALLQLVNNSILTVMENIGEFRTIRVGNMRPIKHS